MKSAVTILIVFCTGIFIVYGFYGSKTVKKPAIVHTVNGPLPADSLGFTLSHEHLMSNFGLPMEETGEYDEKALYNRVIPYVKRLRTLGIETIFDYTANYFGRRADILNVIADSTGMQIITNTGIYGAADDRYVPDFAYEESAEDLARRWIHEFESGINGTGIKPGFIKLAFDEGPPSEIDKKLFEAGVITHLQTGLTLAVHTGSNPAAVQVQLDMLEQYGVRPDAWIWAHANWHEDIDYLLKTASKGAWISLDGVKKDNVDKYIAMLKKFMENGLLHRVLLSHDGDAYPAGGDIRPLEAIPEYLVPALRAEGFSDREIEQVFIENPKNAFAISIKEEY